MRDDSGQLLQARGAAERALPAEHGRVLHGGAGGVGGAEPVVCAKRLGCAERERDKAYKIRTVCTDSVLFSVLYAKRLYGCGLQGLDQSRCFHA